MMMLAVVMLLITIVLGNMNTVGKYTEGMVISNSDNDDGVGGNQYEDNVDGNN